MSRSPHANLLNLLISLLLPLSTSAQTIHSPAPQNWVYGSWLLWTHCPLNHDTILQRFVVQRLTRTLHIYQLQDLFPPNHQCLQNTKCWNHYRNAVYTQLHHTLDSCLFLLQPNHYIQWRTTPPNDPYYPSQWNLHNNSFIHIYAQYAWQLRGNGPVLPQTHDTIILGIIDAGYDTLHPDIHYTYNHADPIDGVDNDNNGYTDDYYGWDMYSDTNLLPDYFHGTAVTGIMSAHTNNNTGIASVSWFIPAFPVAGAALNEAIVVRALDYLLQFRRRWNQGDTLRGKLIVAVNMSFGIDYGLPQDYPIWCAMLDTLGKAGILSVAATTNNAVNVDSVGDIPSLCPSPYLIMVANIDKQGQIQGGYGPLNVDLAAPGTDIPAPLSGGGYARVTGTSFATPHVTGAIGILYSTLCSPWKDWVRSRPDTVATYIRQVILSTVQTLPSLTGRLATNGMLNLYHAIWRIHYCDTLPFPGNPYTAIQTKPGANQTDFPQIVLHPYQITVLTRQPGSFHLTTPEGKTLLLKTIPAGKHIFTLPVPLPTTPLLLKWCPTTLNQPCQTRLILKTRNHQSHHGNK